MSPLLEIPFRPSRGYRAGAYEEREGPICAAVVHTTGVGPLLRAKHVKYAVWRRKWGITDPFEAALWIYQNAMKAGPHFVICGLTGKVAQTAPLDRVAWHVGSKGSFPYFEAEPRPMPKWWVDRWGPRRSPTELAKGRLWAGGSCNAGTLGIEIVPTLGARAPWSAAAWRSLAGVLRAVESGHVLAEEDYSLVEGWSWDEEHVLTHSDAHPFARTRAGKPWDPHPEQWDPKKAYARLRRLGTRPLPLHQGPKRCIRRARPTPH